MAFSDFILRTSEHLTPFRSLTWLCGKLGDAKMGALTRSLIRCFISAYKINLAECADPVAEHYECFNDFFTRALKKDVRPLASDCLAVSPVDGTVTQAGDILAGRLIQAKGIDYSLRSLLGGDKNDSALFEGGHFASLYLSPHDYHRVHMPLDGTMVKTVHIPGRLFPVGRRTQKSIPGLYTKNERLVCIFGTDFGPFAVIMVGAALVGSIHTSWAGTLSRCVNIDIKYYDPEQLSFHKGDELGWFRYGSTVICLWSETTGRPAETITPGTPVKMGEALSR